jgi:heme oxygenase
MTLPDMIRQTIAASHASIEETPAAKGMIGATIGREAYCRLLAQLSFIHRTLETQLSGRPELADLYNSAEMKRSHVIDRDLANLDFEADDSVLDPTSHLMLLFRQWGEVAPWMLIGPLYVLEGSRMGSMALVRPVAKALGLEVRPNVGVDYHLDGMATRPQVWMQFKAKLAATALSDAQKENICRAAAVTMTALHGLYSAKAPATVAA